MLVLKKRSIELEKLKQFDGLGYFLEDGKITSNPTFWTVFRDMEVNIGVAVWPSACFFAIFSEC